MSYLADLVVAKAMLDTAPAQAEDWSNLGGTNADINKHIVAAMQTGITLWVTSLDAEAFARMMSAATILTTERITAAVRAKSADPSLN